MAQEAAVAKAATKKKVTKKKTAKKRVRKPGRPKTKKVARKPGRPKGKKRGRPKVSKVAKKRGRPKGSKNIRHGRPAGRPRKAAAGAMTIPVTDDASLLYWHDMVTFLNKNKGKTFTVQMDGTNYTLNAG